jgi:hypothetical protein
MALPRRITTIRRAFDEARPADISSTALENGLQWAIRNDPELAVDIEDELDFRANV